jgi:hypothetical protein
VSNRLLLVISALMLLGKNCCHAGGLNTWDIELKFSGNV